MSERSHRNRAVRTGFGLPALLCLAWCGTLQGVSGATAAPSIPCLRVSQFSELANSLASPSGFGTAYDAAAQLAFGGGPHQLTAFEENRAFIYASGALPTGAARRLIILKPSIFVVEDQEAEPDLLCLSSESEPEISGRGVRLRAGNHEIVWETPLPQRTTYSTVRAESHKVKATSDTDSATRRILHLIYVAQKGSTVPATPATLSSEQGQWDLTVPAQGLVFHLWLPDPSVGTGEIAISTPSGTSTMIRRPLPSGILPHGPAGSRLLETWDAEYRGKQPAAWDIGRPADELRKLVKEGTVHQCSVVDLGCGSGTDAIFLAQQGFKVTGIDISPTALGLAEEKARKAGVSVRWMLADVTAPPNLGPFDFIYDRGCYHNVRDQNLEAYLETVHRFSRPGTKLLVLSARHDAQSAPGSSGVSEEELRFDFSPFFDVEWLREIMLESNELNLHAPGWSALLRRNDRP